MCVANFRVEGIAIGEGDDDGIVVRIASGLRQVAILHAVGSEKSEFADFQIAGGRDDIAYGGRVRNGDYVQFSNVRIAAEAHAIGGGVIGRWLDRQKASCLPAGRRCGRRRHRRNCRRHISREKPWA